MQIKKVTLFLLSLGVFQLPAQESYIDGYHNNISDAVFQFSHFIDQVLSNDYGDKKLNTDTYKLDNSIENVESIDTFFKTDKFLDETQNTYLRIHFNTLLQSKNPNSFKYKVRAHLPLSRTKKSYNLFIDDLTTQDANNPLPNQAAFKPSKTVVGINYFAAKTYGISSKYSIGASGFNPYLRARYNLHFKSGSWTIEPHQIFKYSAKDKFEEETIIYFDKKTYGNLLRFVSSRNTKEKEKGMGYSFSTQYFIPFKNHLVLNFKQSFFGNTKYYNRQDNTINPSMDSSHFGGIYNYASSISLRQNIWKKWFFYEINPGCNFHRKYDYKTNYSILFS